MTDEPERLTCPSCDFTADDIDVMIEHRVASHTPPAVRTDPPASTAANTEAPAPTASVPDTPKRSKALPLLIIGAIIVVVAAGGAIYFFVLRDDETHTIEGTVSVFDFDSDYERGAPCSGQGGYDDLRVGASVEVRNEDGRTIATSEIRSSEGYDSVGCELRFTVEDVPTADFYEVEVSHRGGLTYSRDEMVENDWEVSLSIGS